MSRRRPANRWHRVPERARATLDAAVYAAADVLHVPAANLRAVLVPILAAIGEVGIDARTARAMLETKRR